MKNVLEVYTDGAAYTEDNVLTWAYIIVRDERIVHQNCDIIYASGKHAPDVETAESEAMYQVIKDHITNHPDNYILYTDSKSLHDKIYDHCNNASKNPHIKFIQDTLKKFKESPLPISFQVKWRRRCSNDWMSAVNDLTKKENFIIGIQ